jgi:hypothetical protein
MGRRAIISPVGMTNLLGNWLQNMQNREFFHHFVISIKRLACGKLRAEYTDQGQAEPKQRVALYFWFRLMSTPACSFNSKAGALFLRGDRSRPGDFVTSNEEQLGDCVFIVSELYFCCLPLKGPC